MSEPLTVAEQEAFISTGHIAAEKECMQIFVFKYPLVDETSVDRTLEHRFHSAGLDIKETRPYPTALDGKLATMISYTFPIGQSERVQEVSRKLEEEFKAVPVSRNAYAALADLMVGSSKPTSGHIYE